MSRRPASKPLFLESSLYRRSRAIDAARILPVAGFVLILMPIFWIGSGRLGVAGQGVYVFGLWLLLIAAAAFLSRTLRPPRADVQPDEPRRSPPLPETAKPETAKDAR